MKSANRTILIAGMGTSPAVLTETVWALAHQEKATLKESLATPTTAQVTEFRLFEGYGGHACGQVGCLMKK